MKLLSLFFILITLTSAGFTQVEPEDESGEIYAQASAATTKEDIGAAGFCAGGAWRPIPNIAFVADFSRHFVSDIHLGVNTFLVGPRLLGEEHSHLSGFFQVLTGVEQSHTVGQPTNWNPVLALGAGADIRLGNRLVWRAIQLDATLNSGQSVFRVSSGFAYRFGH